MCTRTKYFLFISLLVAFIFPTILLAQNSERKECLLQMLNDFTRSPEKYFYNIKEYEKEFFVSDEMICYLQETLNNAQKQKKSNSVVGEEKIISLLYLMERFPSADYVYILKQIIETQNLSQEIRAKAVLALGKTNIESIYFFNLFSNITSDKVRAASLHTIVLRYAFESDYKEIEKLLEKLNNQEEVDYSGTLTGDEISDVAGLFYKQKELEKKKTLEEEVIFLVEHTPAVFPTNYYFDTNLIRQVFLKRILSIYDSNPELVVKILREYSKNAIYEGNFLKDSRKIAPISILCELGICNENEKEFIDKFLRDSSCG